MIIKYLKSIDKPILTKVFNLLCVANSPFFKKSSNWYIYPCSMNDFLFEFHCINFLIIVNLQDAYPTLWCNYPTLRGANPTLKSTYPTLKSTYPTLRSTYPGLGGSSTYEYCKEEIFGRSSREILHNTKRGKWKANLKVRLQIKLWKNSPPPSFFEFFCIILIF